MSGGAFKIWRWEWSPRWGNLAIKYRSSGEWKDIKADGRNNSRKTWLGYKNAEIDITLESKDDSAGEGIIDNYVSDMLQDIGPRGPNGGKPFAWQEQDQFTHNVFDVTVDKVETDRTPGTGKLVTKLTLSSWVLPKAGPIVTKTPDKSGPWSPGPTKPQPANTPKAGFTITPPVVKP